MAVHEWQTCAPQLCFSRAVVHHRTHQYGGRARGGALYRHCGTQIHASDTQLHRVSPVWRTRASAGACLLPACADKVHDVPGVSPARAPASNSCTMAAHVCLLVLQLPHLQFYRAPSQCTCPKTMRSSGAPVLHRAHAGALAHDTCATVVHLSMASALPRA